MNDFVVPDTLSFNNKDIIDIVFDMYQSNINYLSEKTTLNKVVQIVKKHSFLARCQAVKKDLDSVKLPKQRLLMYIYIHKQRMGRDFAQYQTLSTA